MALTLGLVLTIAHLYLCLAWVSSLSLSYSAAHGASLDAGEVINLAPTFPVITNVSRFASSVFQIGT